MYVFLIIQLVNLLCKEIYSRAIYRKPPANRNDNHIAVGATTLFRHWSYRTNPPARRRIPVRNWQKPIILPRCLSFDLKKLNRISGEAVLELTGEISLTKAIMTLSRFCWRIRQLPIVHVLCGAFLISFSGIFVKLADVTPTASAFYRVFFGSIFLFGATVLFKDFKKLSPVELLLITFCGLVFALDLFFWHESIMYIGPGLATLIGNFQVFLLAAVGIFFLGEKSRPRFFFAVPLALFGLLLVVGLNWGKLSGGYKLGIYLGLLTAVCYTIFLLSIRKIQSDERHSIFSSLMIVSLSCAFFLAMKMLANGDSFTIPDLKSLFSLLGLGLFSQTIGWVLIANAMPKIRASFTGLILLLQPALAFVWDVLIFDRPTDMLNWTGVVLTLAAIYMGVTGKARHG